MLAGILAFIFVTALCTLGVYVWKDSSKETKKGLTRLVLSFLSTALVIVVILFFSVYTF